MLVKRKSLRAFVSPWWKMDPGAQRDAEEERRLS